MFALEIVNVLGIKDHKSCLCGVKMFTYD